MFFNCECLICSRFLVLPNQAIPRPPAAGHKETTGGGHAAVANLYGSFAEVFVVGGVNWVAS